MIKYLLAGFLIMDTPSIKGVPTLSLTTPTKVVAKVPAEKKETTILDSLLNFNDKLDTNKVNTPKTNVLTSLKLFDTNTPESDTKIKTINANTRVLHIGDSHTAGIYGKVMDKLFRETGAKVETFGSAGSSPSWWFTGKETKSGFYSKDENNNVDSNPNWKTPHKTPIFKDLVSNFKPNVIVISLGANLIKGDNETIEKEVKRLCEAAKESGAKIIWVGPPDGRESVKPTSEQKRLYEQIEKVVKEYGSFIDSRPYTEYPIKGGDGVHYGGEFGSIIANEWANKVFNDIQNLNE